MSPAKTNQSVCRKREGDEAAAHLQIGVEQRVSNVSGRMQEPQANKVSAASNRPKKDESKTMNPCPKTAPMTHKAPKCQHLPRK